MHILQRSRGPVKFFVQLSGSGLAQFTPKAPHATSRSKSPFSLEISSMCPAFKSHGCKGSANRILEMANGHFFRGIWKMMKD